MTQKEDLEDKKVPNLWLGIYFCEINYDSTLYNLKSFFI